jgi:hypothetical protein
MEAHGHSSGRSLVKPRFTPSATVEETSRQVRFVPMPEPLWMSPRSSRPPFPDLGTQCLGTCLTGSKYGRPHGGKTHRSEHCDGTCRGCQGFLCHILELKVVMDLGWILTFAGREAAAPQISIATEGGSGTPVPDLSIEVDNLDEVHQRVLAAGSSIEYGPQSEPGG